MAYAEVKGFDSFTRMSLCVAWKSFYTIIFFIVKFFLTTTVTLSSPSGKPGRIFQRGVTLCRTKDTHQTVLQAVFSLI